MAKYFKLRTILKIFVMTWVVASFGPRLTISYAHNLDQSSLNLEFNESNYQKINFEMYLSWQSLSYIVEAYGEKVQPKGELVEGKNAFDHHLDYLIKNNFSYEKYLKANLIFSSDNKECTILFDPPINPDKQEVLIGRGVRITGFVSCPVPIKTLKVVDNVLFDEVPLQTNNLTATSGSNAGYFFEKILSNTDRVANITFVSKADAAQLSNNAKGYIYSNITSKLIQSFTTNFENNIFILLLIVFGIGFLHTLEPGHDKIIISSLILNKKTGKKHILAFITSFVVTHISDIAFLAILINIVGIFIDIYQIIPWISRGSAFLLFGFSVYYFYRNLKKLISRKLGTESTRVSNHSHGHFWEEHSHPAHAYNAEHSHSDHVLSEHDPHEHSIKKPVIYGFLTGLAPCPLGWAILMILISSKKIMYAIPIIVTFGLGVFAALLVVSVVGYKIREKFYVKLHFVEDYSALFSYFILAVYSLFLLL